MLNQSFCELFLSFDHGFNTIVHILDKGNFGTAKSAAVRDVIDVVVGLGVFTVSTTDLYVVLVSDSLEVCLLLSKVGQVDVDTCAKSGTEVSRA